MERSNPGVDSTIRERRRGDLWKSKQRKFISRQREVSHCPGSTGQGEGTRRRNGQPVRMRIPDANSRKAGSRRAFKTTQGRIQLCKQLFPVRRRRGSDWRCAPSGVRYQTPIRNSGQRKPAFAHISMSVNVGREPQAGGAPKQYGAVDLGLSPGRSDGVLLDEQVGS